MDCFIGYAVAILWAVLRTFCDYCMDVLWLLYGYSMDALKWVIGSDYQLFYGCSIDVLSLHSTCYHIWTFIFFHFFMKSFLCFFLLLFFWIFSLNIIFSPNLFFIFFAYSQAKDTSAICSNTLDSIKDIFDYRTKFKEDLAAKNKVEKRPKRRRADSSTLRFSSYLSFIVFIVFTIFTICIIFIVFIVFVLVPG